MDNVGSRSYFDKQLEFEESATKLLEQWLQEKLNPETLKNISKEPNGIRKDIDYLLHIDGVLVKVECKIRSVKHQKHAYKDILLETKSSTEMNTEGWITKSEADLLAYVWKNNNHLDGYIFNLPLLREWWNKNSKHYLDRIYAPNPPLNPLYHTENVAIPINDLPLEIIFYPQQSTPKKQVFTSKKLGDWM